MKVVVRQASFPFHISQICLVFSSCGYIQLAFHTSRVLEVDLRQANFLTSEYHCPVSIQGCEGSLISYFLPQADQILPQIGYWAEHLDLRSDNHYVGPGHIHLFIMNPLVKPFSCLKSSCFHMLWKWTTPRSAGVSLTKSVEFQLQDTPRTKCGPPLLNESQIKRVTVQ